MLLNTNNSQESKIISYTRCVKTGKILNRPLKDISNTLHTASGGGGNTDQFVLLHNLYGGFEEKEPRIFKPLNKPLFLFAFSRALS